MHIGLSHHQQTYNLHQFRDNLIRFTRCVMCIFRLFYSSQAFGHSGEKGVAVCL